MYNDIRARNNLGYNFEDGLAVAGVPIETLIGIASAGPIGPIGPQGVPGIQGIPGVQGNQGVVGNTGPRGDKGEKGDAPIVSSSLITSALGYIPLDTLAVSAWAKENIKPTYTATEVGALNRFETKINHGNVANTTVTLNVHYNVQTITVTGPITLVLANFPVAGKYGDILLEVINGGNAVITFPSINWILPTTGATVTSFSDYLTAIGRVPASLKTSGTDFILIWYTDAGATLYGKLV